MKRRSFLNGRRGEISSSVQASKFMYFALFTFVLAMTVVGFMLIVNNIKGATTSFSKTAEDRILAERFLAGPQCLAAEDPYPRITHRYVLDWDKFANNDAINRCYNASDEDTALRIRAISMEPGGTWREVSTNNYRGQKDNLIMLYPVLILKDGKYERGVATFYFAG